MSEIILVSVGGFLGAISRFALSKKIQNQNENEFPSGTLTVNLIGAFLLGMLIGTELQGSLYTLLGIGFMGAFTTFSTLMLEAVNLKKAEKKKLYYSYLISSYAIGIILAVCGLIVGRWI
jgi:fluoride exporter